MPLATGAHLGPYEILALLGAGGMGEVYRARDTLLKRDVAIKVLPLAWSRDRERLRRFELEAQAAAALNHPNIVSIFHIGHQQGSPYIVTELLQGETLRDRLRRGPVRLREALDLAIAIARGLAAAHSAGIVHRDLKPENLFLTKDGRVKILDFGLAKLRQVPLIDAENPTVTIQKESSPGQLLGTVGYMSPEQVRGHAADARSDIFALGVILYEMLTGKRAFQKPTSAETMSAILNEDPPTISQVVPDSHPGLQRIVNRCLEKSPGQRFQDASDLAFALEALSDITSVVIPAISLVDRRRTWVWIAVVAAAVLVTAVALIVWSKLSARVPVVEAVTQLTDDGEPKPSQGKLVTDGTRIYFNEGVTGSLKIGQVAVTGGPTAVITTRLANPSIAGLSPEGSSLLVIPADGSLWQVPLPAGEPRQLGDSEAVDATFFPDGHVLFVHNSESGNRPPTANASKFDIFVADKDGSHARKVISVAGYAALPSLSPDGQWFVFTFYPLSGTLSPSRPRASIVEARADGSGLQTIASSTDRGQVCCAQWTPDGRYIVFANRHEGRQDIWAFPMRTGLFQWSSEAVPLTNGPLSYAYPTPSRDGKQLFAVGEKGRGELVRYDAISHQFVRFLSGMSAFNPTFSKDGKWVAYASYPDHTLWRSRSDGTDRVQLSYPPMQVWYPFISPDGKRIAYGNSIGETYVVSTAGGPPQRVLDGDSWGANWSPDGNMLVFSTHPTLANSELDLLDLRTGKRSIVPGSQGLIGGYWVSEDRLVATPRNRSKLTIFDIRTQQWSDLVPGTALESLVNWAHSPDYKYLYWTTGGAEPKTLRIRLADRKVEAIASLKDLTRAIGPDGNTQISVAPDGSPVFTRDIGSQEVYALSVKWP